MKLYRRYSAKYHCARHKHKLANIVRLVLQRKRPWHLLAGLILIALLLSLMFTWGSPNGWGLDNKTRWDWLNLLGAPLLLSAFGFWLQQWQKHRDRIKHKEEIIQEYFDQLSSLLIDKDILSPSSSIKEMARSVVRARTLTTLRRLTGDCERKGCVISYLSEMGILSGLKVSLAGADLEDANLDGVNISNTNLTGARLVRSKLKGANLAASNFGSIDVKDDIRNRVNITWRLHAAPKQPANLSGADLRKAYLVEADLRGADLTGADLRGAIFGTSFVDGHISNGAKLEGANLSGILWDEETRWPNTRDLKDIRNMPISLKHKLGLP
jgi:uncharacterized protein YjbI with pentapeptide repeats